MKLTNKEDIPLMLAVAYAYNGYTGKKGGNVLSVTQIIKPVKQLVMAQRSQATATVNDISQYRHSAVGTALHDLVEKAWSNPDHILRKLGWGEEDISKVHVNPSEPSDGLDVYTERRVTKSIPGTEFLLSGESDFIYDGAVMDLKTTSVYVLTHKLQENYAKWKLQMSMYRWLMPEIITKDTGYIVAKLNNWDKFSAARGGDYPSKPEVLIPVQLLTLEETEEFITTKVAKFLECLDQEETLIPICTEEDTWSTPIKYKYYRNRDKLARATKVFDTAEEANKLMVEQGSTGIIIPTQRSVRYCAYCDGFSECKQGQYYLQTGAIQT